MTDQPDQEPRTCYSCGHPWDTHDERPDGHRSCRSVGHQDGVSCADCRAMLTSEYREQLQDERDADWFQAVWGAYTVTLADARHAFGDSAAAFFSDIHQSALASALIAYRKQQATEQAIARVEAVCHELPYEYARLILDALENTEPTT